jgi:cell division protein ZapE
MPTESPAQPLHARPLHLVERTPSITGAEIVAELTPPPQFEHASFESYRPDLNFSSQLDAVDKLKAFAESWRPARPSGFFSRTRRTETALPGVYLDGGFGVGKTHLLAALWHEAPGPKYFGTFIEYTALVGALGYADTVAQLRGAKLICIDEFELDDPGDTMLMTRLLAELVSSGTRVAATSNTPPNSLGEGRFAAQDFLREIQAMAGNFETVRIDGLDYRRRDTDGQAVAVEEPLRHNLVHSLLNRGSRVTEDDFGGLLKHLSTVHPSRYIKIIRNIDVISLTDVFLMTDQTDALRLVAFIDRVYDAEIPIIASGLPLNEVFDATMLDGGYRKKYQRSQSRMVALTTGELPPHEA